MSDYDARLVELYDLDNPDGPDHDYYRAVASRVGARRVLDLGCGTGILTVTLAGPDRTVFGIDPSASMLAYAAARPRAAAVEWILGDSRQIPVGSFDLVVMTGNVVQHIPDAAWQRTLSDVASGLRPGGLLAFESRNPTVRAWDLWSVAEPTIRDTAHGPLREWMEVAELGAGQVLLTAHNEFLETGEHLVMQEQLSFRELSVLQDQLEGSGFLIDEVWGDWNRSDPSGTSPLLVIEARRG